MTGEHSIAFFTTVAVFAAFVAAAGTTQGCSAGADAAPASTGSPLPAMVAAGGAAPLMAPGATPGASGVAAAGGATGVPAGTGGSPSSRDPNSFSWPESSPDGGFALCKPGHYVGAYKCDVHPPPAFAGPADAGFAFTYTVNGPVDLTLDEGQSGEFLTVSGGSLKSTAASVFSMTATVQGELDCRTGVFSGQLVDGEVSIPPFPPGGTFTGTMNGSFQPGSSGLDGTWNLVGGATFLGISCSGPWNATYQGP